MSPIKKILPVLILVIISFSCYSQQSKELQSKIEVIQAGTENYILSQIISYTNTSTNLQLSQFGVNNNTDILYSNNLEVVQEGNNNYLRIQSNPVVSSAERLLQIYQAGNRNQISSYGTNSLIENAIIEQRGNGLDLMIYNY